MIQSLLPSPILIVADSSESGIPCWEITYRTILMLIDSFPEGTISRIAFLGTRFFRDPASWISGNEIPAEAKNCGSFIAPTVAATPHAEDPKTVIIVGSGEIFDLLDWVSLRSDIYWLLIQSGEVSLKPQGCKANEIVVGAEINPDELTDQLVKIKLSSSIAKPPPRSPILGRGMSTRWKLDITGYPMVYVPPIDSFVHLFPITKIQFEKYLAESIKKHFGDRWYSSFLSEGTSRGSIWDIPERGLERQFITGIRPEEAMEYAKWDNSQNLRLPTVLEWQGVWSWFKDYGECSPPIDIEEKMSPTAHYLWQFILKNRNPMNVNELSCLSGGVWEWVKDAQNGWMGMGDRASHPFHNPLEPIPPVFLQTRPRWFGFRLIGSEQ